MPNVYRLKTCPKCNKDHRQRGQFCCQTCASQYNSRPGVSKPVKIDITIEEKYGITQELLKEIFDYYEGNLYWKKTPHLRIKQGDKAGYTQLNGRVSVTINNKTFQLHRLIYIYHYGSLNDIIDHINRNPSDNRIENLRICNYSQNMANRVGKVNKTSGYAGVIRRGSKYISSITYNKETIKLGTFDNPIEAYEEYKKKHLEIYGEYSIYR
jgi:hypothetical protein